MTNITTRLHRQHTEKPTDWVTGTIASSGDNTIIAAPTSSYRIVITSVLIQNESSTATTAIIKDGATGIYRVLCQNQGDGLLLNFDANKEWELSPDNALVINLSGDNSFGYSVSYYIR